MVVNTKILLFFLFFFIIYRNYPKNRFILQLDVKGNDSLLNRYGDNLTLAPADPNSIFEKGFKLVSSLCLHKQKTVSSDK
jgi:hypothetical protein